MTIMVKLAYVRLITTKQPFLEIWKQAFLDLDRFNINPLQSAYSGMIDMALEEAQLDVEDIVSQFESCALAWVQLCIDMS